MSGGYHLRAVMAAMDEHLDYHWQLAYLLTGGTQQIHPRKVISKFKPILWYQKG